MQTSFGVGWQVIMIRHLIELPTIHWALTGVMAPTGRIVEDERVFGGIEFGIGSQGASILAEKWDAPSHTDGTILKPDNPVGWKSI